MTLALCSPCGLWWKFVVSLLSLGKLFSHSWDSIWVVLLSGSVEPGSLQSVPVNSFLLEQTTVEPRQLCFATEQIHSARDRARLTVIKCPFPVVSFRKCRDQFDIGI